MAEQYDLIVIGGVSAGLVAAGGSAILGAKVALIEKTALGGDCLYTGCVPSKALIKSARFAHEMRQAGTYGFTAIEPTFLKDSFFVDNGPGPGRYQNCRAPRFAGGFRRYGRRGGFRHTAVFECDGNRGGSKRER